MLALPCCFDIRFVSAISSPALTIQLVGKWTDKQRTIIVVCVAVMIVTCAAIVVPMVARFGSTLLQSTSSHSTYSPPATETATPEPSATEKPLAVDSPSSPPASSQPPAAVQSTQPPVQPGPALPAPPAAPKVVCPSGLMHASLTSVAFTPYEYRSDESIITARGVLRNDTTAEVLLSDSKVPDFIGLDARGNSVVIERYGDWDWAPPPGTPRQGFFTIQPGQSVAYTVKGQYPNEMLATVKFWYTAAEIGSLEANFNSGELISCRAPLAPAGKGQSIPATNLPAAK